MAFIPLPNGLKVELKFNLAGQLMVNIFHVTTTEPIIEANLSAIAEVFVAAWAGNMSALQGAAVSLQEVVVTDVSEDEGIQVVYTDALPEVGTAAGDLLPFNVAVVSSNKSIYSGRSRRGRTYWGGFTEPNVGGSTPVSAILLGILGFNTELVTELDAINAVWGVASYQADGAPRTTALFTPFTAFSVDGVTDSQRRRLPGRGI